MTSKMTLLQEESAVKYNGCATLITYSAKAATAAAKPRPAAARWPAAGDAVAVADVVADVAVAPVRDAIAEVAAEPALDKTDE